LESEVENQVGCEHKLVVLAGARRGRRVAVRGGLAIVLWLSSDVEYAVAQPGTCLAQVYPAVTPQNLSLQAGHLIDPKALRMTIRNVGKQTIVLPLPGDGSESGLRTPIVSWSVEGLDDGAIPQKWGVRDDNLINPLRPEEVIELAQNQEREFSSWIPPIFVKGPGRYRVKFHFINDPQPSWKGIPMRAHDAATMQRVKKEYSLRCVQRAVRNRRSRNGI
jgi:hypothetical protein